MSPLSSGQLNALRNLDRKRSGADVGWINIADAQSLTSSGLAERHRGGWKITAAGIAELKVRAPAGDEIAGILVHHDFRTANSSLLYSESQGVFDADPTLPS